MNTTEWSHLPNAAHIDAVIASVKANPDDWDAAYDAAYDARFAAWCATARPRASRHPPWRSPKNSANV